MAYYPLMHNIKEKVVKGKEDLEKIIQNETYQHDGEEHISLHLKNLKKEFDNLIAKIEAVIEIT